MSNNISIIIPAKNESQNLRTWLPNLKQKYPQAQIILVDDGSSDDTSQIALNNQIEIVKHPYSLGNGAAIKAGFRNAKHDICVFMDADGQHQVEDIAKLVAEYKQGYDMVIGARKNAQQASYMRLIGNRFYNKLASIVTNHKIEDLTSGFRVVNRRKFAQFLHLLPNGFSYPTTITMAFCRSGYTIKYMPINVLPRQGKSHLSIVKDGLRFLFIIYKMTILYSPGKVLVPLSALHFLLGLGNYIYTFVNYGRFTNMSMLFFAAAIIILLVSMVLEQITALMYQNCKE